MYGVCRRGSAIPDLKYYWFVLNKKKQKKCYITVTRIILKRDDINATTGLSAKSFY